MLSFYTEKNINELLKDAKKNIKQACKPNKATFLRWEIGVPSLCPTNRRVHYAILSLIWIDPENGLEKKYNIAL